ncbi:hypothetical protein J6590_043249 [Homalodisca vitripennis]|nr:hypothetical protein J6590_043249 [Homalodisca vitripennis]
MGCEAFSDLSFLCKFIAMVVNILTLLLWQVPDKQAVPMTGFSEWVLFQHTVAGYMVVLVGFVLLYLFGEPPELWAQRIFVLTGAILFLITGILGLIFSLTKDGATSYQLLVALFCTVCAVCLIVDFLKNENIF